MARIEMNLFGDNPVDVFVPQRTPEEGNTLFPTVWLLHDFGQNQASFGRYSRVELMAEKRRVAVVCVNCPNAYYVNVKLYADYAEKYGSLQTAEALASQCQYADYINRWLSCYLFSMLPLSRRPQDNVMAGVGMGGYGALRLMLDRNSFCRTAISVHGELDAPRQYVRGTFEHENGLGLFGAPERAEGGPDDLFALLQNAPKDGRIVLAACEEDEAASRMAAAARAAGLRVETDATQPPRGIASLESHAAFILENAVRR